MILKGCFFFLCINCIKYFMLSKWCTEDRYQLFRLFPFWEIVFMVLSNNYHRHISMSPGSNNLLDFKKFKDLFFQRLGQNKLK